MAEEVFFREWARRAPGSRRDLGRALLLADVLGLRKGLPPVLTVVGSKGKGTTATYASAFLAAAGLRVLTVTSPALRHNRERIRVNGKAISEATLATLAARLDEARPAPAPTGYLSPAGMFLIAGILHGRDVGADVLVLEAGMGGRSDEVSLFPPTVVAMGPIFAEHLGVLGETPEEIAVEKAGVAAPQTAAVVSAPQTPAVASAIARTVAPLPVETITIQPGVVGRGAFKSDAAEVDAGEAEAAEGGAFQACVIEAVPGLEGFRGVGAALGSTAASRLLEAAGLRQPGPDLAREVLGSVRLPGRLSWHVLGDVEVLVDSAIDRAGVAAALKAARERWPGGPDHVLLCLPDHKDLDGAVAELGDLPVTFVRLPETHLRFTRPLPANWRIADVAWLSAASLAGIGHRVIALGTVYFTGRILDLLGAETETLWALSHRFGTIE